MASKTVLLALAASVGARAARLETKEEMIAFLSAHPSRAYFSRLIRDGPYDVAMEVGVADGRFSEHFLLDAQPKTWYIRTCSASRGTSRSLPRTDGTDASPPSS